jgi:hypothetical protein
VFVNPFKIYLGRHDNKNAEGKRHQQAAHTFIDESAGVARSERKPGGGAGYQEQHRHLPHARKVVECLDWEIQLIVLKMPGAVIEELSAVEDKNNDYRDDTCPVKVVAPLTSIHNRPIIYKILYFINPNLFV